MKKRFLVVLIVVAVLIPATLSAGMINLSIGATARYDKDFDAISTSIDDGSFGDEALKLENYAFGADVRLKIALAEIDLVGMFGSAPGDYITISVLTSAGISLDILNIARLGIGMGPRFNVLIDKNGNATVKDENNVDVTVDNFGDVFIKSPVAYRATLDFNIGNMMLGLNYTVDTTYTFENWQEIQDLFDAPLGRGKVGLSFLFSLI